MKHAVSAVVPLFAFVGLLAAPSLRSQDPAAPAKSFVLEAGEHELSRLVVDVGEFLGRTHLIDEKELGAIPSTRITLPRRMSLDAIAAEDLLSQLTASRGFAMTTLDADRGVYEWVMMSGPKRTELPMRAVTWSPAAVRARPNLMLPVTVTVDLQHANPAAVVNALRPFFMQGGYSFPINLTSTSMRSIVVLGFARDVARVLEHIEAIDRPTPPMEKTDAQELDRLRSEVAKLTRRVEALEKQGGKDDGAAGGK
jgi:type II secretory pathway component GspD/PulD (secretin)